MSASRQTRLHNQPLLAHIEMRIEKLRSGILQEELYHHLDNANASIIDFCAEGYSIWCEAKFDSDTFTELLLAMRDEPGGKERPLKQFVYYIIAQRDLPYLMVQARNIIIAVLEMADDNHDTWFPGLNMPPQHVVSAKINEHGPPTKIAGKWLTERSKRSRQAQNDEKNRKVQDEQRIFRQIAAEHNMTPDEWAAKLADDAALDKLRDAIVSMTKRIPEIIRRGLAVPTKLPTNTPTPLLMCEADGVVYRITLEPPADLVAIDHEGPRQIT